MEELTRANQEIENRIRELEELSSANALNDEQFEALRQMLSVFRAGIDEMSVEEKRAAIRSVVRKVVWDGQNAHVVLFGAEEGDIDFPDLTDRFYTEDDQCEEDETLDAIAAVRDEEFDDFSAEESRWGEDRK